AQHDVRAAELTVDQQRRNLGPSVQLQADVGVTENYGNSNYNHTASAGVVMSQSIYAGGRLAALVRRAMATRDAAKANLIIVQKDVIQGVNDAYVRYQTATSSLTASNERVRAAQVAFEGIRE
ncbi:TolC family protein, partial [Cribrihabitans sp. XS_ASV171]